MAHGDLQKQTDVYRALQKYPTRALVNRVKINTVIKESLDKPLHQDLAQEPRSAQYDVVSEFLQQY